MLKNTVLFLGRVLTELMWRSGLAGLAAEAVQGAALALEGVHHIKGGDCLAPGVLSVSDSVPDHVLQEHLEHAPGLLVDEARDALDTTTPGQPADGGLGDALDVVPAQQVVSYSDLAGTVAGQSRADCQLQQCCEVVVCRLPAER